MPIVGEPRLPLFIARRHSGLFPWSKMAYWKRQNLRLSLWIGTQNGVRRESAACLTPALTGVFQDSEPGACLLLFLCINKQAKFTRRPAVLLRRLPFWLSSPEWMLGTILMPLNYWVKRLMITKKSLILWMYGLIQGSLMPR